MLIFELLPEECVLLIYNKLNIEDQCNFVIACDLKYLYAANIKVYYKFTLGAIASELIRYQDIKTLKKWGDNIFCVYNGYQLWYYSLRRYSNADIIKYVMDNPRINDNNVKSIITYMINTGYYCGAIKIIDEFKHLCFPDRIWKHGNTALMNCCWRDNTTELAIKMIDTFGLQCMPGQVDQIISTTALLSSCRKGNNEVAIKLIDVCGIECRPGYTNSTGKTALIYACKNGKEDIAMKLIDTFKYECSPDSVDCDLRTALMYACISGLSKIAMKLIRTFGHRCNIKQVDKLGNTVYDYAVGKEGFETILSKLEKIG